MMTKIDFMRYQPPTWDDFIGNRRMKDYFRKLVRRLRVLIAQDKQLPASQPRILVVGESRSGKTAIVKFSVRCVICAKLDPASLDPCDGSCGQCDPHKLFPGISEWNVEWEDILTKDKISVSFRPIDSTHILTPTEMRAELNEIREGFGGIRIVYFDEVHRLVKRGMDEMLLTAVEDKSALWVFSTAKPKEIEDMFKNRAIKLETQLPAAEELEDWIADRLIEVGVNYETEAIVRLVEKSNRIVGLALLLMDEAALDPDEGLTVQLVEDWVPHID